MKAYFTEILEIIRYCRLITSDSVKRQFAEELPENKKIKM